MEHEEYKRTIWHDISEEPVMQDVYYIPCLIQDDLGFGVRHWNVVEKCWDDEDAIDYYCEMENIKRWCYIKDLLPKKGEEE